MQQKGKKKRKNPRRKREILAVACIGLLAASVCLLGLTVVDDRVHAAAVQDTPALLRMAQDGEDQMTVEVLGKSYTLPVGRWKQAARDIPRTPPAPVRLLMQLYFSRKS